MTHTTKWLKAIGIATALLGSLTTQAAELKPELMVVERVVRLSDLFYDAGENASQIVFEAPAPGKSKSISAKDLERIAIRFGIDWERPTYLKRVNLMRLSSTIAASELSELVHQRAIDEGANPDTQVRFFGRNNGVIVPVDTDISELDFEQFSLNEKKNRFNSIVLVPSGGDLPTRLSINGTLEEVREVPVFSRSILPGEEITEKDINWISYPANRLTNRTVLSSNQLVGMTVRRPIRADKLVNSNDVTPPVAVEKGSAVTMLVRSNLMILTATGRALENGGVGDTIRVINAKSRLTVDAKILSAGQVEIISAPSLTLGSR